MARGVHEDSSVAITALQVAAAAFCVVLPCLRHSGDHWDYDRQRRVRFATAKIDADLSKGAFCARRANIWDCQPPK